jgi:PKD repeat protein
LFQKKGFRQPGRQARIKPAIVGILLIILGALFIPACAGASVPVAAFVSNITGGNVPMDVQFIDSSTNTPTSWFWSFGDGGSSTLQNPTHSYTTAGTYTVILAATNEAGTDTETKSGYITTGNAASAPVASFVSNTTSGTVPLSVQFVDMSTNSPASWVWSFGDGGTSTLPNPVHTFTTAGTYTVTLTTTNGGGSSTATKAGYIGAGKVAMIPVAAFVSSVTSGTAPLTVQFVDSTTNSPTSWIWSFGDGNMSTLQNPTHTFLTSNTYTVTLIATNSAGSDTLTKTDYITVTYKEPVANFSADVTRGTAPLTVQFTDSSTNSPTTWSWKFGDGGKSTDQNPIHKYTDAGEFAVSLTAKNSAGSNITKITHYITVISASSPVAAFTADTISGTVPLTVRFNDTTSNTPTSWVWSFGDGSSSAEENPAHTYANTGTYTVSLTAANDAGNSSKTAINYINANAVNTNTVKTTIPATDETITTREVPATVTAAQTTAPAASAQASSSFPYVIAGIIAIIVIGIGAALYSRSRSSGGHHRGGGGQL